jgi:uncharacterized protein
MKVSLSIAEARRLALHAQGFGGDRSGQANWTAMKRELQRLHLLQIDSVNVLVRQHYLPLFSRLGDYDRAALDKRSLESKNRALFECWAHEASLVRMELHPLMRWRMERARRGDGIYKSMSQLAREEKAFLKRMARLRKAICLVLKKVQVAGGDGAKASWPSKRSLRKALSRLRIAKVSSASTMCPSA